MIELLDVKKTYRMGEVEVPALRGITLKIKRGNFIAIMGPSGSGKSTLMNSVGSLDLPTSGKILLDGQDITRMGESNLAQLRGKKVGFVFQQFNLISTLTALENVALPLVFQGVPKIEREKKARRMLESLGLGDRMNHKPTELSGGQQQRVAIARALVVEPEVILADEPTGNVDSKTGGEIIGILEKLHSEGRTIIIVTHDPNLAKHAHDIVRIKDGLLEKN
ncbi:MAG: ABC transporter ATP-binding protein [Candidatus Micrarchaeota archaeon]